MSESIYHARNLRAIGQDLEARGVMQFELMAADDGYLVRVPYGATRANAPSQTEGQQMSRRSSGLSKTVELGYSLQAIDTLDEKGRAKRGMGNGMPDFFSLSQCLRALGGMIDSKGGQLLQLDRNAQASKIPSIVVQYQTSTGERVREEHSLPNLYDYCVHLYKTRRPVSQSVNPETWATPSKPLN